MVSKVRSEYLVEFDCRGRFYTHVNRSQAGVHPFIRNKGPSCFKPWDSTWSRLYFTGRVRSVYNTTTNLSPHRAINKDSPKNHPTSKPPVFDSSTHPPAHRSSSPQCPQSTKPAYASSHHPASPSARATSVSQPYTARSGPRSSTRCAPPSRPAHGQTWPRLPPARCAPARGWRRGSLRAREGAGRRRRTCARG